MNRTTSVLVVLAVLAGAMVPAVAMAQPDPVPTGVDGPTLLAQTDDTNATENGSVPPGAMLAGSIGAGHAEIRGAVEQRAFGLQVAAAATNQSRAHVVAQNQERLQERLDGLQERLRETERARENGSISQARYQAQVTAIAAQTAQVRAQVNTTAQVAAGMPTDVLQQNGVNVTALEQLREQARTMTGPEVARLARQIAGNDVGKSLGSPHDVPPGKNGTHGGPNDGPGDGTDGHGNGGQSGGSGGGTGTGSK